MNHEEPAGTNYLFGDDFRKHYKKMTGREPVRIPIGEKYFPTVPGCPGGYRRKPPSSENYRHGVVHRECGSLSARE